MKDTFILLAYPRTGSYHLMSMLNSSSDVTCYGEVFKRNGIELPKPLLRELKLRTAEQRNADPLKFLSDLKSVTKTDIFGFKIFLRQAKSLPEIHDLLWNGAVKRIVLFREPIATYASLLRANQTKIWTLKENRDVDPDVLNQKVTFTEEGLASFAGIYASYLKRCNELSAQPDTFMINYDQIGDPEVMSPMLQMIGSKTPPEALQSFYRRQFTLPLEEGFDNWDELAAHLKTKEYFGPLPKPTVATP